MDGQNTVQKTGSGKATASLILGILSILFTVLSLVASILGILAIVFGLLSLKSTGRGKAIAGIITGSIGLALGILFIGVLFVAIPSLQRNKRDNARRSDITRITSAIINYQSENTNKLPLDVAVYQISSSSENQKTSYAEDLNFNTNIIESIYTSGSPDTEMAVYTIGENCDGKIGSSEYSVSVLLESGDIYCQGS